MFERLSHIFDRNEARFIGWFVAIFLMTAAALAAFGLLPSELQEESSGSSIDESFSQAILRALSGAAAPDAGSAVEDVRASQRAGQAGYSEFGSILAPRTGTSAPAAGSTSSIAVSGTGLPQRISIPKISMDTEVRVPASSDVATLDKELLKGPVYYPGSGTGNGGNMFIFGHSTGHSVVINKAYKVFNNIKLLSKGDEIFVQSDGRTLVYRVRTVDLVDKNDTMVTFDTSSTLLTLSTCNSFGTKADRYVVVAELSRTL